MLAGWAILPGGFLGVDIFFVISGYLIASIILSEMAVGSFSFANFYQRRARRILPILLLVMLCCSAAAWAMMLPKALLEYAWSQVSSIFFASNIWFWLQDSYTAEASELRPLLHTWSLSVEEQFYLFFPVFLLLLKPWFKKSLTSILGLLLIVSLALAHYSSTNYIEANFYLAPTRAWELLAGVLLARFDLDGKRHQALQPASAIMPVIGLLLILVPMALYHDDWPHPSLLTVVPISGTMIIIWYLPQPGIPQRLLASRLFTSIGLVSYSLYLWHFPVFAFAKIGSVGPLTTFQKILCLALSAVLTVIGYWLIEKPARNRKRLSGKWFTFLMGGALTLLLSFSFVVVINQGVPQRLGSIQSVFEGASLSDSFFLQNGRRCDLKAIDLDKLCYFPQATAERTMINVGDSHADVLANPLFALAKQQNWNFRSMTLTGCPYVEGAYRFKTGSVKRRCDAVQMNRMKKIIAESPRSIVVYSGRFAGYLNGVPFDNKEGGKELHATNRILRVDPDGPHPDLSIEQLIQLTLENMLNEGHVVVLVYPVPEVGWDVPKRVKQKLDTVSDMPVGAKIRAFESMQISTSYSVYKRRNEQVITILDEITDRPNLIRIFPDRLLCSTPTDRCYTHDKKTLLYYDNNHLSQQGAALVVNEIASSLSVLHKNHWK